MAERRLTRGGPFHAIAHRGDPLSHTENTLPGIASALAAGADLVEIDIKITADGQVVVLHDDTLERLWGKYRMITELSSGELAAIGTGERRIPLLAEVLELVGSTDAAVLIDMDHPRWALPGHEVVREALARKSISAEQVVWCGRPDSLEIIRCADPQARIVFSWDESNGSGTLPPDSVITELSPEAFNPHWPMINEAVIDWAAGLGLAVSCWTVDDPDLMKSLLGQGVDAMITNRIRLLQEVRDDR